MNAIIITIGDELLSGNTVDTNSTWIANALDEIGIQVVKIITIPDQIEVVKKSMDEALSNSDLVFCTGGLGPTHDDVTKHAILEYFEDQPVFNEEVYAHIEKLLASFGREVNDLNKSQAYLPSTCEIIRNERGTAPGMMMAKNGAKIYSMPGVPFEMKGMMLSTIIPQLKEISGKRLIHKVIKTIGVPEADLAPRLKHIIDKLDHRIKLAFLPSPGQVKLRLSGTSDKKDGLESLMEQSAMKIIDELKESYYGIDDESLEMVVGRALRSLGKTIATAESCTGGKLASKLTSVPGSSNYFEGSVVAYSNSIKTNSLGLDPKLLDQFGAVSKEVAESMADQIRIKFKTDYGLSTTGIAGPDGGSAQKPVGTIWIAMSGKDNIISKKLQLGFNRKTNIDITADLALDLLRKELIKNA